MRTPRELTAAAGKLLETLIDDDGFRAWVAADEIDRRVAAGELVPTEQLRIAPGLELVPVGVVDQLRSRLRELATHPAVAALDEVAPIREACLEAAEFAYGPAVGAAAAETTDASDDADDGADDDDEPAPEPAETPPTAAKGRTGLPAGAPQGPAPCILCPDDAADVDAEQALFSWTRWRKVMCKHHHETYQPAA